jgi:O-antigen/teichoic acid export membrane protein
MQKSANNVIRHAGAYLLARGVPGIISFLAIPLFTRLLDPDGYGKYALASATAAMISALAFQWLRLAFVRYLPGAKDDGAERLKSTLLTCQLILVIVGGAIALGVWFIPAARPWRTVAFICWLIVAVQPMFELFCEQARALIQPRYYMGLQLSRSALVVGLGVLFIKIGLGWWGPLLGLALGSFLPALYAYGHDWRKTRLAIDWQVLKAVCQYGIPLSLTVALAIVIGSSDRYIIAYYLGDGPAGIYSAAVDFTSQTLSLLMMAVSLAILPLAIRAWEHQGPEAAREQMRHNATLLFAIGIPAVAGLVMLAPSICFTFLGKQFWQQSATVMPLIAIGTFLAGYKQFHLDSAFQFVHRTIYQVWIVLIAAIVNIALNLLVVRRFGVVGAAGASIVAYIVSMLLTASYGRKHFALPFPARDFFQVVCASGVMTLLLLALRDFRGPVALAVQVISGGAVYVLLLLAMNFLNLRATIVARIRSRLTPEPLTVTVQ